MRYDLLAERDPHHRWLVCSSWEGLTVAEKSSIGWTQSTDGTPGATWNPIRGTVGHWHCVKLSPGCDHCYAAAFNSRLGGPEYVSGADQVRLDQHALMAPSRWRRPRRIFVCSMTDIGLPSVTVPMFAAMWAQMLAHPRHTYMLLTKRPDTLKRRIAAVGGVLPPHIWVGVTIERDDYCWRADILREIPAPIRWISAEPMLGPLPSLDLAGIAWVVTGGESGRGHRAFTAQWALDLLTRCHSQGVAGFHKQGAHLYPGRDRLLAGQLWEEWPDHSQPLAPHPEQ